MYYICTLFLIYDVYPVKKRFVQTLIDSKFLLKNNYYFYQKIISIYLYQICLVEFPSLVEMFFISISILATHCIWLLNSWNVANK